jgi:hypothetical protein
VAFFCPSGPTLGEKPLFEKAYLPRAEAAATLPSEKLDRVMWEALLRSRPRQKLVLLIVVLVEGAAMELRLDQPTCFA